MINKPTRRLAQHARSQHASALWYILTIAVCIAIMTTIAIVELSHKIHHNNESNRYITTWNSN